jgi:hypothetical protein
MKTNLIKIAAAALVIGAIMGPTVAGAQPGNTAIQHRIQRQHARIREGLKTGTMTQRQANGLRARDARIHAATLTDRARDGGHLTAGEHARLERRLNGAGHKIYQDKH